MNKSLRIVVVLLLALVSISLCSKKDEAIEFVKHLREHTEGGTVGIKYWSEKIFKIADDHSKEADALRTINLDFDLRQKLSLVSTGGKCFNHFFVLKIALEKVHECKEKHEKKEDRISCVEEKIRTG